MSFLRSLLDRFRRRQLPELDRRGAIPAPPSPTVRKEHGRRAEGLDVYAIMAVQYSTVNSAAPPRPELYLRTRCAAVAKYILFEHDPVDAWPVWHITPMDPVSLEHQQFSLRMRRCGAIIQDDTRSWHFDDKWYGETEVCQHPAGYLFGWPKLANGKQPVWAYRHPGEIPDGLEPDGPTELDILRQRLYELDLCTSMETYCKQLEKMGASYYDDVRTCPAAEEAGIVRVNSMDEKVGAP